VPPKGTPSGLPYDGTADDFPRRARTARDGRDRSIAHRIGGYPTSSVDGRSRAPYYRRQRQDAEQTRFNDNGGTDNLDNKRNETRRDPETPWTFGELDGSEQD
jgi:hypothetical protein